MADVPKLHNDADKGGYVFRDDRPEAQPEPEKAPAKTSAKSTSTPKEK